MFDSEPYNIQFIQKASPGIGDAFKYALIYKFFTQAYSTPEKFSDRLKYIIRLELHEHDVFTLKYYVARDRKRDDKYSKLTNNSHAQRIFVTCVSLLPQILHEYPNASFAFNASRTIDIRNNKAESLNENQRFRIYRAVVFHFIGDKTFEHYSFEEVSSYLLVNRKHNNTDMMKDLIRESFLSIYDFGDL